MGQNQVILRHQKFTFPTSEGVSEVSERASERTDERVAQYLRLDSCLFQTTVGWRQMKLNLLPCLFSTNLHGEKELFVCQG